MRETQVMQSDPAAAAAGRFDSAGSPRQRPLLIGTGPRRPAFGPAGAAPAAARALDPCSITSFTRTPLYNSTQLVGYAVELCWAGGSAPYTLVASSTAAFAPPVTTVAAGVSTTCATTTVQVADLATFLNVVPAGVAGPAVGGVGYNPIPPPTAPSVSQPVAWWGDTLTFTAQNLDPIAEGNVVMMPSIAVKPTQMVVPSGSLQPTGAEFTVPEDARGFYAIVQAHGRASGARDYVMLSPRNIGPFTGIHGLSWSPVDGRVLVAAAGVLESFDVFSSEPSNGACLDAATYTNPYVSRFADGGSVAVIDGVAGVQSIELASCAGGTLSYTHFAYTNDDGFTDAITPVGIALSPDGLTAYVADEAGNRVVRIPYGAAPGSTTIEPQWGGSTFTFADPCGIDVAPGGQVMVFDDGSQTVCQLTSATGAYCSTSVHPGTLSLQVDRDLTSTTSTIRSTVSTAPGMTEAFNLHTLAGASSPAFTGAKVYGYSSGELSLDYDWNMYFTNPQPQRVITNSEGETIPYPSGSQTSDAHITVYGKGWPGVPLELRVIDPPDLSAYWAPADDPTPTGPAADPPYVGNDNLMAVGALLSDGGSPVDPLYVVPDSHGDFAVDLVFTSAGHAGDNFQIRMRKVAPASQPPYTPLVNRVTAYSTIYTSWKRVYAERDRMFRKGGVLARDYLAQLDCGSPSNPLCDCTVPAPPSCCSDPPPATYCNQIEAYDWQTAAIGDDVAFFDEVRTYEAGPDTATITGIGSASGDGRDVITLSAGLSHSHAASASAVPTGSTALQPTFSNYNSAGYGVISACDRNPVQLNAADSCFYDADVSGVELPYDDAYIELFAPRDGMNAVPFLPGALFIPRDTTSDSMQANFSRTWFAHWSLEPGSPEVCHRNNHFHLVGAGDSVQDGGLTAATANTSYVFVQRLANFDNGGVVDGGVASSVEWACNHELGHQFSINFSDSPYFHDQNNAWCNAQGCGAASPSVPLHCVMNVSSLPAGSTYPDNRRDGVDSFCKVNLFTDSTGGGRDRTLRGSPDPI